jgi:hypothetical protein
MAAITHRLRVDQDGLFTNDEHAVLSDWFGQQAPAAAAHLELEDALAQLGFGERCHPYSQTAVAVAHIVLEAIEDRLPAWACWNGDELIYARRYRKAGQKPRRRAVLLPNALFAIDWATSAPGSSWPVSYHLVWLPIYGCFVVTASADCTDAFGYADFALGHFGRDENVGQSVIEIIKGDWTMQRDECGQKRWEEFLNSGLVKKAAVHALADQVWPENDDYDDPDDDDDTATQR